MWYNVSKRERVYVSVYFSDALAGKRGKGDLTLAFDPDDHIYRLCKRLGSSRIKALIGIETYGELVEEARLEDRSLGNYVKHKLRSVLEHEEENTSR